MRRTRWLPLGQLDLCFPIIVVDSPYISGYDLLEEIWHIGGGLNQVIRNCSMISFCSGSKSRRTNFATTCSMPRSCIKISDTVVFRISRSASSSHTVSRQSLLIAAHTWSTFSGVLLVPGLPECRSLSTDSWPSLKHLCHTFICTALCNVPERHLSESSE